MNEDTAFATSCLGARFRAYFRTNLDEGKTNHRPPDGVDHFEWKALLESVESAGDRYTMVELGAGFGWWGINAAAALNREHPGKPGTILFVEGEPQHFAYLETAIADNPFPDVQYTTVRAAVGSASRRDWFYTGRSSDWYGQRLILDYHREHLETGRGEHIQRDGSKLKTSDGYELSEVDVLPLPKILEPCEQVDLLDMDIQGSELEVVSSSLETLRAKCRRLFIATHSVEIHEALLGLLKPDWDAVAAFPPQTSAPSEFGPIELVDGVQHWKRD
jgi:FkbM family methyltransferase